MRYNIYSLEVWGNTQVGYWVNDMFKEKTINIPNLDIETIFRELSEIGTVYESSQHYNFKFEGERIAVTRKRDGYPVADLFLTKQ